MFKKIMTPPAWSSRKEVTPFYQLPIFNDPLPFCPPPSLEINNDWSLISIITYQKVVVKTNNNNNIIINIIIYNKKCWGDID